MINYSLTYADKNISVQIEKDYNLHVKKKGKQISIQKEKGQAKVANINNECDFNDPYSLNGHISTSDIFIELANIKHIGFEITDSCNLKCTYCIYGKFYENHDIRLNKKMDPYKAKLLIIIL